MGDNSFELVGQREATRPGSGWLSQSSALVLVALFSSICHTLYFIAFPLGITLDSPFYINGAYHLLSDNLLLYYPVRTPGYQIIVAAPLFISGGKVVAARLFQHPSLILLGVLVTWRLYPFGRPKLALLCGLLIGANPALGLLSSFILSETIFLFIVTSVLLVESLPSIRSRLSPLFRYVVIGFPLLVLGMALLLVDDGVELEKSR